MASIVNNSKKKAPAPNRFQEYSQDRDHDRRTPAQANVPQQTHHQESSDMSSISQNSQMDAIEFVERHCRFFDEDPEEHPVKMSQSQTSQAQNNKQNNEDDDASLESFQDQAVADDEFNSDEDSSELDQVKNLVPLEFAKQHIQRIESDMKTMHERHVNLMREMDTNYKLIEQETQDYYIEFLQKWRELAKNKISQYRRQSEMLQQENTTLQREKQNEVAQIKEQLQIALLEKQKQMQQWKTDIDERDLMIEQMRISHSEQMARQEREQANQKQITNQLQQQIKYLTLEIEDSQKTMLELRDDCAKQIQTMQRNLEKQQQQTNLSQLKSYRSTSTATTPSTTMIRVSTSQATIIGAPQNEKTLAVLQPAILDKIKIAQKQAPKKVIIKKATIQKPDFTDLDQRLNDFVRKKKLLSEKILPWQTEQRKLNGDKKPTLKKTDPIYPDYQEYLTLTKQITQLQLEKDEIQKQYETAVAQKPQLTGRRSQSVSPSKQPQNNIPQTQTPQDQEDASLTKRSTTQLGQIKKEYEAQLLKLQQEAELGIAQREDAIKRRDEIIKKQKLEQSKTQDYVSEINQKLSNLQRESKLGEELLVAQFKELKNERDQLKVKFDFEQLVRKRLHNQIEDMKGKIRVFCRVRPMSEHEKQLGSLPVITVVDQYTIRLRLKREVQVGISQEPQVGYKDEEYQFDSCFGENATQDEVFEDSKMLMQSALDGFNVCLFAYGQTGSGKTHTIQGTSENPGIVPNALKELFFLKQKKSEHCQITFECYMVELYLDCLHDLLLPTQQQSSQIIEKNRKLELREDPVTGMINILNITTSKVTSINEAFQIYKQGVSQRKTGSTEMNDSSSRSHFIFSIIVHTKNLDTNQQSTSKISFVDLAGSEKVNKSKPTINQLKEAKAINQSLSSLKDVIRSLSAGTQNQFVPYRNNKLTHLMRDSIGGNSKTLMFVNISPADYNAQESKMSLFFGCDVKQIKNDVRRNVESQDAVKLREENEQLRKQVEQYKQSTISSLTNQYKTTAATTQALASSKYHK